MLTDPSGGTAVEQFARRHEEGDIPRGVQVFRQLVPLATPQPGQQYAFDVDLDACSGCKACVTACHSLNGLDEDEAWRSVGLLHGTRSGVAFQQTVTTACHHCVEPACLAGCPVDAYEKDPVTGIVVHLDDQCIGCGYCTLTCPYEVPQFNAARGIVRKCDLCRDRLSAGEAPACVQACPTEAIRIAIVDTAVVAAEAATGARLVPGAPPSSVTVPTTVYRTRRPELSELAPADRFSLRPAHAHPPLALMLVLTQLAVGAVAIDAVVRALDGAAAHRMAVGDAVAAALLGVVALAASTLHLGRPRYAFRAVIGVRHSWLSREIVAFGAFAVAAVASAAVRLRGLQGADALTAIAAVTGGAGVWCSAMVYGVTHRRWWRLAVTGPKFGLSALLTGGATVLAIATAVPEPSLVAPMAALVVTVAVAKAALELSVLLALGRDVDDELHRTARLLVGDLRMVTQGRFLLLAVGAITAVFATAEPAPAATVFAVIAVATLTAGELVERSQFFRAVAAPAMPGAPS